MAERIGSTLVYQLNPKNRMLYTAFFAFKFFLLALVLYEGMLLYKKFGSNPEIQGYSVLFLVAELLIVAGLVHSLYTFMPRYGNNLSPVMALSYKVILERDRLVVREHFWARELAMPLDDIIVLAYGGYIIFKGTNPGARYKLNAKSRIRYMNREYLKELLAEHKEQLYLYRINLSYIDDYRGLKMKLLEANPQIRYYEPEINEEEKED